MKTLIASTAVALALVGVVGCAEDAGVTNSADRYTVPEATAYAAPARGGQVTGVTGEPSGAGGIDLSGEARPGMWDASRSAKIEQPAAAPSPYQNLPAGSAAVPSSSANPTTPAPNATPRTGTTAAPQGNGPARTGAPAIAPQPSAPAPVQPLQPPATTLPPPTPNSQ